MLNPGLSENDNVIKSNGSSKASPMISNPHTRFAMVAGDFIVIDLFIL
jgi:hypothetical protein